MMMEYIEGCQNIYLYNKRMYESVTGRKVDDELIQMAIQGHSSFNTVKILFDYGRQPCGSFKIDHWANHAYFSADKSKERQIC